MNKETANMDTYKDTRGVMLNSKGNIQAITNEWICSDDDSHQMVREIEDGVYELYQVTSIAPTWMNGEFIISHAVICVDDVDIKEICENYGFESIENIKAAYGEAYRQILAECEFENHATEYSIVNTGNGKTLSYDEAVRLIDKMIGSKE